MKRLAVVLVAAAGCASMVPPDPTPPTPAAIVVPQSPAAVVQLSARELLGQGFELVTSDAAGGVLVAQRKRAPKQQPEYLRCAGHPNSLGTQGRTTTLRLNLAAVRRDSMSSEVTIRSSVRSEYRDNFLEPNDTDCVSSYRAESLLIAALRR
jgi:hypothetical protein